jgi:hypothetical protein
MARLIRIARRVLPISVWVVGGTYLGKSVYAQVYSPAYFISGV